MENLETGDLWQRGIYYAAWVDPSSMSMNQQFGDKKKSLQLGV